MPTEDPKQPLQAQLQEKRYPYSAYTSGLPQDNYNRGSTYYPTPLSYGSYRQQENRGSTYYPQPVSQIGEKEQLRSAGSTDNVSIKLIGNEDEFITKISSIKGEFKEKAEVERREYKQSKVEASNLNPPQNHQEISKELRPENAIRVLNDSNWVSKPSDLLSDGSILRRNNIRFGIKLKQKQ